MKNIRAALIQQSCTSDPSANIQKSAAAIRRAAEAGAELIILPELHTSLYFCQTEDVRAFDLAEPIPGPATRIFGALAKELHTVIVTSLFERRAPGVYHNTSVVFERHGAIAGIYRKMHIPDDPGYYEKFYFTPGDIGFTPIQTSVGKLGVLICWDQWYPEAARLMALAGADVLIYPTAIGWNPEDTDEEKARQREAWITIQRAHAIANGLPVLAVNRIGFEASPQTGEPGALFWGTSFAAGCQGEILAQAEADTETELLVELADGRIESVRRIWPFLRDRRIDAYAELTRRMRDDTEFR